jgi:hypothetical protein
MDIHHLRYLKPWPQASVEHSAPAVVAPKEPTRAGRQLDPPSFGAASGDAGTMTPTAYDTADTLSPAGSQRHPGSRVGSRGTPASPPGPVEKRGPARPHLDTSLSSRISGGITWN